MEKSSHDVVPWLYTWCVIFTELRLQNPACFLIKPRRVRSLWATLGRAPPPFRSATTPYFWKYLIKILVNAVKLAFCSSNSHFRGQNSLNIAKFRWLQTPSLFSGCRRSPENLAQIWPKAQQLSLLSCCEAGPCADPGQEEGQIGPKTGEPRKFWEIGPF